MSGYKRSGTEQEDGSVRWAPRFTEEQAEALRAWAKERDLPVTTAITQMVLDAIGLEYETRSKKLPPQQALVLGLVQAGKGSAEIASILGIGQNHVCVVTNILRKKGCLPPRTKTAKKLSDDEIKRMLAIMEQGVTEAKQIATALGRTYSGTIYKMMRRHGDHLLPDKREYRRGSAHAAPVREPVRQPWRPGDPKPQFLKRGQA